MSVKHQYALIMAGGAGTRLWPISRRDHPKQFQSFAEEKTLLQHMVGLVQATIPLERILIMAIPKFRSLILEQIPGLPPENILFEPMQKDTGPAVLLGILQIHHLDPDAQVAIFWSDHYIQNSLGFSQMLEGGFLAITEHPTSVIIVGVNPTEPNTGFGYIQMGKEVGQFGEIPVFSVRRFAEKPDFATATRYVNSWDYLWNVGYEFSSSVNFLELFNSVQPELAEITTKLLAAVEKEDHEAISSAYEQLPKKSLELLFTQQVKELLVIPADLEWSDLGAWDTLHNVLKDRDPDAMVTRGQVISIDSKANLIFAKDRPIALVGVENLVVVDDGDVILVMHKEHAQSLKKLTQELENLQAHLL